MNVRKVVPKLPHKMMNIRIGTIYCLFVSQPIGSTKAPILISQAFRKPLASPLKINCQTI